MINFVQLATVLSFGQVDVAAPLQWRLRWNWDWPLWVTTTAIVVATLWVMAIYFRETSSAGKRIRIFLGLLRLSALGLALLMFAQPAASPAIGAAHNQAHPPDASPYLRFRLLPRASLTAQQTKSPNQSAAQPVRQKQARQAGTSPAIAQSTAARHSLAFPAKP